VFRWALQQLFAMLMLLAVSTTSHFGRQEPEKAKPSGVEQERIAIASVEDEWLNALNRADVNAIAELLERGFYATRPGFRSIRE
jgi:hypothetical protein